MMSNINLEILYEDNHLIFVNKPFSIPVQQDKSNDLDLLNISKNYIKDKYQKLGNVFLGLVHRLDRQAGGVMVFAKTSKAASRLSEQIRSRNVEKEYLVVVQGLLKEKEGTLENFLVKDKKRNVVKVVKESINGSKYAKLDYRVVDEKVKDNMSVMSVDLKTGRFHQIRVQFSNIGLPIFGDVKYGGDRNSSYNGICLWARRLKILHPTRSEPIEIEAQVPDLKPWSDFNLQK